MVSWRPSFGEEWAKRYSLDASSSKLFSSWTTENSRFCNKCGKRVADEFIDPELEARLLERIQSKLKEDWLSKDSVEKEIALKAATRLSEWTKLFALAVGVPLALIALILAFFGIRSTSDLANLKKTSDELTKQYEPLKAQLPELNKIVEDLRDLDRRVSGIEIAASVQTRKVAINRCVRDLANKKDKAALDTIAEALGLPKSSNLIDERNNILLEMDRRVQTVADMDALSEKLKTITNKDF